MQVSFSVAVLGLALMAPIAPQSKATGASHAGVSPFAMPVSSLQELKSSVDAFRSALMSEGRQIASPPTIVKVTVELDESVREVNLKAREITPRLDIKSGVVSPETIQTYESIMMAVQIAASEEDGQRVASLVALNLEPKMTPKVSHPKDDAHRFMSTFSSGI